MITFSIMICTWVNSMLFCVDHRSTDFRVKKEMIASLASQDYRLVEDLSEETLAHAVTDKLTQRKFEGCKVTITGQDPVYSENTCKKLQRTIESQ